MCKSTFVSFICKNFVDGDCWYVPGVNPDLSSADEFSLSGCTDVRSVVVAFQQILVPAVEVPEQVKVAY